MTIRTRFAPSPTGFLHIGNARAALFCYLFARAANGAFVLRLDDTDAVRSTPEFATAIEEDLNWLGIIPDEKICQSARFDRYAEIFETLKQKGLVYPCYETPAELDRKRKRQMARGAPPVYDRAALALTDEERASLEKEGRTAHWRFKLSGRIAKWHDLVRGEQKIETTSLSDPVLLRADGTWLYTLPSVVDDIDMNITHVIRGEDHVSNTAVQLELLDALGAPAIEFAHFSLMLTASGENLSKRAGSQSLRDMRNEGLEPMAINSLLARLGMADAVQVTYDMQKLIDGFDISRLGRALARFDVEDVRRLTAQILHDLPYEQVTSRLAALGAPQNETFWYSIRSNLTRFSDVTDIAAVITGTIAPIIEDADYIATALAVLPSAPFDETSWQKWTQALKQETGRKGRDLFMPLRLALTGQEHGPEMRDLLPLIGYEKSVLRLKSNKG